MAKKPYILQEFMIERIEKHMESDFSSLSDDKYLPVSDDIMTVALLVRNDDLVPAFNAAWSASREGDIQKYKELHSKFRDIARKILEEQEKLS